MFKALPPSTPPSLSVQRRRSRRAKQDEGEGVGRRAWGSAVGSSFGGCGSAAQAARPHQPAQPSALRDTSTEGTVLGDCPSPDSLPSQCPAGWQKPPSNQSTICHITLVILIYESMATCCIFHHPSGQHVLHFHSQIVAEMFPTASD